MVPNFCWVESTGLRLTLKSDVPVVVMFPAVLIVAKMTSNSIREWKALIAKVPPALAVHEPEMMMADLMSS